MRRRVITAFFVLAILGLAHSSAGVEEVAEPVLDGCSAPVTIVGSDPVTIRPRGTCSEVNGECMDGDDACTPCGGGGGGPMF
jgi:hypothetical protein